MLRRLCGRFEGTLDTRWTTERLVFAELVVVRPFAYVDCRGRRWAVDVDAKTDGASFPWWLNFVPIFFVFLGLLVDANPLHAFFVALLMVALIGAPLHAAYIEAATVHDAPGYRRAEPCSLWGAIVSVRRAECDQVFFEAILTRAFISYDFDTIALECGAPVNARLMLVYRIARAGVMWLGVRVGGWIPYFNSGRRNRCY